MSCTILYPFLLLLFSCATMSEVQHKEKGAVQTETTDVEESIFPWIHSELAELKSTVSSLEDRLQVNEAELEQLKRKEYRVAFAATLGPTGNLGPFNTGLTLVYKHVFVNVGNAYNPTTGIFTAPVKGVYFFTFSGHNRSSKAMALSLFKNGQQMLTVYNHPLGDRYDTASNSISLILEKADHVYMRLWENTWVFDNENDHTSFNGYLLFSL